MVGPRCSELVVGGVSGDSFEEHADLCFPSSQVGTQYRGLFIVGQLGGYPVLAGAAEEQVQLAPGGPNVADPLPGAPRRDEVLVVVERQQVYRHPPRVTRVTPWHLEDPAAPDADPGPGEQGDRLVEDVLSEPAGLRYRIGLAWFIVTSDWVAANTVSRQSS